MHSRRLVAALIGLVLAACPVLAIAGFVAANNPAEGRFEVVYESGVTIVFNAYSQVASVSAPNGQSAHFTFAQLAAQNATTAKERQAYVQRLVASITSPDNWSALTDSTEPTLNLPISDGGGGGGGGSTIPNGGSNPRVASREEQTLAESSGNASVQDFGFPSNCGPLSIGCDCAFGMSCSPFMGPNMRIFYIWDSHSPGRPISAASQMCMAMDRDRWALNNASACRQRANMIFASAAAGITALGSCSLSVAAPPFSWGLLAICMGSMGGTIVAVDEAMHAHDACVAPYPGPPSYCFF